MPSAPPTIQQQQWTLARAVLRRVPVQAGQRRLTRRVRRVLAPPPVPRQIRLRGHGQVELDLRDRLQAEFFLTGLWEPAIVRQIVNLLPSGGVFFDVGANVGLATLSVAWHTKEHGVRIHAFEPAPENAFRLRRNLELNPGLASRVHFTQAGVSSAAEELGLTHGLESGHHHLTTGSSGDVTVPVITLSEYARDHGIARIDCMKVDVEGWELEVFRGADELFRRHTIRALVCEVEQCHLERAGTSAREVVAFLLDHGYVPIGTRKFSSQVRDAFVPGPRPDKLTGDVFFFPVEDMTED